LPAVPDAVEGTGRTPAVATMNAGPGAGHRGAGLRVLHLIPTLEGGGAERQLGLLAPALARRGADVHVGYLRSGPNSRWLESSAVSRHMLRSSSNRDPRVLWRVYRLVASLRADIVQTWLPMMDVIGGLAALLNGTPWVMSERSAPERMVRHGFETLLRQHLGRHARALIANSQAGRSLWAGQLPAQSCHVVPNALPLQDIDAAAPAALSRFVDNPQLPLLVYAGRFVADKNVHVVLDAFLELAAADRASGLLCGSGPEEHGLRRRIADAGAAHRIRVLPFRTDLWSVFKTATAVISLSRYEGMPNVIMEAMACRCPLVVSDIPGHREVLDPAAALLVPSADARAAAAALQDIISDPRAAALRAERARQLAETWTVDAQVDGLLRVFATVTAESG
jgi:glycosyltransferase involved in cell wall biosynthesis